MDAQTKRLLALSALCITIAVWGVVNEIPCCSSPAGGKMIALRLLAMKNNENQENLPGRSLGSQTAPFFDHGFRIEIPFFSVIVSRNPLPALTPPNKSCVFEYGIQNSTNTKISRFKNHFCHITEDSAPNNIQWLHPRVSTLSAHPLLLSDPAAVHQWTRTAREPKRAPQQHVDHKITNALLKKGTRDAYKTWNQQDSAWVDMRLDESHDEGGFGVPNNTITRRAAAYTTNARFVAFLGTFACPAQQVWLPGNDLQDPATWMAHSPHSLPAQADARGPPTAL
jgi:hypothetical protein